MNKAFFLRKEDQQPRWWIIDAEGQVLGRLSTRIADVLRGRHKAEYTPHSDAGDYIVVINAEKIVLTGNKLEDKEYARYTGWIGGLKITTAAEMLKKFPERVIEHAVKGMLPKNKLSDQTIKKLKVYAGTNHPHAAQNPQKA
ncbi:50S ribosomal protein L13 [Candidatus Dependentiae bacterium HGW-Dependentiae-1]|nr:MAG: 50S ribosomal protein L13 [Candidatus Dependentiae bacterium HGW-Dependentiae-1]